MNPTALRYTEQLGDTQIQCRSWTVIAGKRHSFTRTFSDLINVPATAQEVRNAFIAESYRHFEAIRKSLTNPKPKTEQFALL